MKSVKTGKWGRSIPLALLVLLACGWAVSKIHNFYDKEKVKQMTATMKTICVGRFLIDVPAAADVSFAPAFVSGWTVSVDSQETDEQFASRLTSKEAELKATKNERHGVSLESVIKVEDSEIQGRIFVFDRTWQYGFEGDKRVDSTFAVAHAYARTLSGMSVVFTSQVGGDRTAELGRLIKQIKPLAEGEIPERPGFCFGPAMIREPLTASQNERVTMFLSLKDHPDFEIALDTAAGLKPGTTLLARDASNSVRQDYAFLFNALRRGDRAIGGIPGQELAYKAHELNGTTTHDITWESISDASNVFQPELSLEFSTGHAPRSGGKPVGSSLADDAVLALWDKISSSIRVRPTNAEKPLPVS